MTQLGIFEMVVVSLTVITAIFTINDFNFSE